MDPTRWIHEAVLEGQAPASAPDDIAEEPTAGYLMSVGTTLVRGAVTLARGLGFESLWCGVLEANGGAVRFLHAAGFREVRRARAGIGARRDVAVVILSRPVSAAG